MNNLGAIKMKAIFVSFDFFFDFRLCRWDEECEEGWIAKAIRRW
jgi:hypothetical protein